MYLQLFTCSVQKVLCSTICFTIMLWFFFPGKRWLYQQEPCSWRSSVLHWSLSWCQSECYILFMVSDRHSYCSPNTLNAYSSWACVVLAHFTFFFKNYWHIAHYQSYFYHHKTMDIEGQPSLFLGFKEKIIVIVVINSLFCCYRWVWWRGCLEEPSWI